MAKIKGLYHEVLLNLSLLMGVALLMFGAIILQYVESKMVSNRAEMLEKHTLLAIKHAQSDHGNSSSFKVFEKLFNEQIPDLNYSIKTTTLSGSDIKEDYYSRILSEDIYTKINYTSALLFWSDRPSELTIVQPLVLRSGSLGKLQITWSLQDVRDQNIDAFKLMVVFAFAYGAVLVGYGLILFGRKLIAPISNLVKMTDLVAQGDLSASIVADGPKEILLLGSSFNKMVKSLSSAKMAQEEQVVTLKNKNEEIRQTQRELINSERLASVGHLAAGMAHEIGNPLGAIVGYIDLLKKGVEDDNSTQLIEHISSDVSRIDRLVRDLLDYADPKFDEVSTFTALESINEVVNLLDQQGALKSVQLSVGVIPDVELSCISKSRLAQILINLIINAIEAAEKGISIIVEGEIDSERIYLSVSDDGPGIREDIVKNIFDPFFTTKETGSGRGLGLAVTQRIIDEAGGGISVMSRWGEGTTFIIELPYSRGEFNENGELSYE